MSEPAIEIIRVDPRIPEALELIEALSEELARRYDYADDGSGDFKPEGALVARSAFVIGRAGSRAVACGAFRPLQGHVAEIKRMFVVPDYRGRGYSKAVLRELERLARENGYTTVRLETGNRRQFSSMSGQGITASRTLAPMWAAEGVCVSRRNS